MPLNYLSKSYLIALMILLAGCQTIPNSDVAVSETDVTASEISKIGRAHV